MSTVHSIYVLEYPMVGPRSSLRPEVTKNRRPFPQTSVAGTSAGPLAHHCRWVAAPATTLELVLWVCAERPPEQS